MVLLVFCLAVSRQWRRRHHCIARADRDTAADVIACGRLAEAAALHASSSGVTVQARRLRRVVVRCAARCRGPMIRSCATAQRYELPAQWPIAAGCWLQDPYLGGGYDGANRGD